MVFQRNNIRTAKVFRFRVTQTRQVHLTKNDDRRLFLYKFKIRHKLKKYYLKRVSGQDATRTTVVNSKAARDFFGINLRKRNDKAIVDIKYLPSSSYIKTKIIKKQDIRIYLKGKKFSKKDIILLTSQGNNCFDLITIHQSSRRFRVYDSAISGKVNYLLTNQLPSQIQSANEELESIESENDQHEKELVQRSHQVTTEILQLVKARRGQGVFRDNVSALGAKCRLTGVDDLRYLRASHIKPWRKSTDQEKIDGNNGLMLAPHIDMLFDGGLISFKNDGTLIISDQIEPSVLSAWGISPKLNVGVFSPKQCVYLEHHRNEELKK